MGGAQLSEATTYLSEQSIDQTVSPPGGHLNNHQKAAPYLTIGAARALP